MDKGSLEYKAVSGAKWSFLGNVGTKAITPITFIIIAALISSEDLGIVAISTVFIELADIFWSAGMSQALIQKKDDIRTSANFAFFTNIFLAFFVYGILFFSADVVAVFYKDPRLTLVLQIQGLKILIKSLSAVHFALLRRKLQFKAIFYINIFTTTLPSIIVAIPLAWMGFGYWSLVYGRLFGSFLELILVWSKSNWRPSFEFNPKEYLSLIKFGSWLTFEFLLSWFVKSIDILIIGYFWDTETVGIYKLAKHLLSSLFELVFNSTRPVWYSLFSRIQDDLFKVTRIFLKLNKFFTMLALPMGIGLYFTSDLIVSIFFKESWAGLALFLSLLGLSQGFYNSFFAINPSLYRALKHPEIQPKILVIKLVIRFPLYILTAAISLEFFLYAIIAEKLFINFFLHSFYTYRILKINPFSRLIDLKFIFLALTIMIVCVSLFTLVSDLISKYLSLPFMILIGIVSYFLVLYPFERGFIGEVKELVLIHRKQTSPKPEAEQSLHEFH